MSIKLKIKEIEKGVYKFISYSNKNKELLELRMLIRKYSGKAKDIKNTFEIFYSFPILHENGIDEEIERLRLAKKAISKIKTLTK